VLVFFYEIIACKSLQRVKGRGKRQKREKKKKKKTDQTKANKAKRETLAHTSAPKPMKG